jgi:thiol-disulfide isomerase/thioredoxin
MEPSNPDRRRYLVRLGIAIGGAGLGAFGVTQAIERTSREFAGLDRAREWLNTPRLTAASLAGKVVLVDFCTYTCINWLRTLPYIREWARRYREGLVVIGVHTPEFSFERDLDNVRRAVRSLGIEHPIAIDNDYGIWRAFRNQYWPALYFVDGRGRIRDWHFGEGRYDWSERLTQKLLRETGSTGTRDDLVAIAGTGVEAPADWDNLRSSENYLGFARTEGFASPGGVKLDRPHVYAAPKRLGLNEWALEGEWTATRGYVALNAAGGGRLCCRFHARDLHLVVRPTRTDAPVRFRVSIDGHAPDAAHGADTDASGAGTASEPRLYQLVRQPGPIVDRRFEIEFLDPGVEAYVFTFG